MNNNKIALYIGLLTIIFGGFIAPIYAIDAVATIRSEQQEAVATKKEEREDLKATIATRPGILKKIVSSRAIIKNAAITSKTTDSIVVQTADNKTVTVIVDANTILRRRFWGKATFDEMAPGDKILVIGKWTDDTNTKIQAKLIRDYSIQKRLGVFFGTVSGLSTTGWVMSTIKRGNQTVTIGSATKLVNRKGETVKQSDILVAHRVRVKGLWNSQNNTITEITQVKNYSIPVKPTITPSPTPRP